MVWAKRGPPKQLEIVFTAYSLPVDFGFLASW